MAGGTGVPTNAQAERLASWKEIAGYLKRDVRTVQRWEKREGLPVHRHLHDKLGSVYAYRAELDAWLGSRRVGGRRLPGARPRWWWAAAAALVVLAAAVALWRWPRGADSALGGLLTRRVLEGLEAPRLLAVSPDGRLLLCSDPATSDLAVCELATGQTRRLTHKPALARVGGAVSAAFAREGRRIAYAWDLERSVELRLVAQDGSGDRRLCCDPEAVHIQVCDWSPDGKHILAFLESQDRKQSLVAVGADDGRLRILKDLEWRPHRRAAYSPDGRYVACDAPSRHGSSWRDVAVLDLGSGADTPAQVALVERPSDDFLLGWTPDGTGILFGSDRSGTTDAWLVPVLAGKVQGTPMLMKKDLGQIWPLGLTPVGAFYYGLETGTGEAYLASLDLATSQLRGSPAALSERATGQGRAPAFSPEGRRLAFVVQRRPSLGRPGAAIVVRALDRGEESELAPELVIFELAWAPDGRSLLATGRDLQGRAGLFRVDLRTGRASVIMHAASPRGEPHFPVAAPGGRRLYYKAREAGVEPSPLFVRDLATGAERLLLSAVYRYSLSPDGRRLAYSCFDEQSEFIRVIPAPGGPSREVFRQPRIGRIYSLAWTPDGRHLLFARKGELWRAPSRGGQPLSLGLRMEALRELSVHPDGTRIAFTAGTAKGELWKLENFLPPRRR